MDKKDAMGRGSGGRNHGGRDGHGGHKSHGRIVGTATWTGCYHAGGTAGLEDPAAYIPADNPPTAKKIELGRLLFFDKRLSKTNTVACANCHMPGLAFTDGQAVSMGINRLQGGRSAPTAINRVYSKVQFWDGRAQTLEEQSTGPFINPVEHGFLDYDEMTTKMKKLSGYRQLFQEVFHDDITEKNIGKAIASFQRTLISAIVLRIGSIPAEMSRP